MECGSDGKGTAYDRLSGAVIVKAGEDCREANPSLRAGFKGRLRRSAGNEARGPCARRLAGVRRSRACTSMRVHALKRIMRICGAPPLRPVLTHVRAPTHAFCVCATLGGCMHPPTLTGVMGAVREGYFFCESRSLNPSFGGPLRGPPLFPPSWSLIRRIDLAY